MEKKNIKDKSDRKKKCKVVSLDKKRRQKVIQSIINKANKLDW